MHMENKETLYKTISTKTLIQDNEYYKHIFKKTEKIVCAVLYTLRSNHYIGQSDAIAKDVEDTVRQLMDIVYSTLQTRLGVKNKHLEDLQHALIVLQSRLDIAHATLLIEREFLDVFIHEINSVQRSLKPYCALDGTLSSFEFLTTSEDSSEKRRTTKPTLPYAKRIESSLHNEEKIGAVSIVSRRERILTVLRDKGQATIKDISESVTDCSEKTIQRELTALIKDSVIVREGERRWSKYSIV